MVAPHTGAWIEIVKDDKMKNQKMSLPTRERGLKSLVARLFSWKRHVAPHTGAWIEIWKQR